MSSHDWENELDDSDDDMDVNVAPPLGINIVDRTPIASKRKCAESGAIAGAKTPLMSHEKPLQPPRPPLLQGQQGQSTTTTAINYSSIVDFTPELANRKKAAVSAINHHEKTPLVSHKSKSGFEYPHVGYKQTSPLKEETTQEEFLDYLADDDDDRSVSSIRSFVSTASIVSTASSVVTLSTQYLGNFKSSLMIPFTDDSGSPEKVATGLAALFTVGFLVGVFMPKEEALHGFYRDISSILGWVYFVCWSVCFYPQVLLNYRRKATTGLSHDFAVLNFLGWLCYSSYDSSFYFSSHIQALYAERFGTTDSTVQINDVVFAVHAMILSFMYLVQIYWYGGRKCMSIRLKKQTWFLVFIIVTPSVVGPLLLCTGVLEDKHWLDYFYMLSYLKILCTLTKYTKQAMFNMKRKSTRGWNIWYNFLEFTGGTLSMLQVVFDSANMGDWSGVTGNLAKFALGVATIFFDMLFFTQHYVMYPHNVGLVEIKKPTLKPKKKAAREKQEHENAIATIENGKDYKKSERSTSSYGSTDESTTRG